MTKPNTKHLLQTEMHILQMFASRFFSDCSGSGSSLAHYFFCSLPTAMLVTHSILKNKQVFMDMKNAKAPCQILHLSVPESELPHTTIIQTKKQNL